MQSSFASSGGREGPPSPPGGLAGGHLAKGGPPPAAGGIGEQLRVRGRCSLPSGTFSLLVAMLLFSVQQFLLISLLFFKTRSWMVLLFLCWDLPLLLLMAFTLNPRIMLSPQIASVRCAVQWMAYVLTLSVKMGVIAFYNNDKQAFLPPGWDSPTIEGDGLPSEISLPPETFTPPVLGEQLTYDSLAYIGVYLLPVIFVVFTIRAKAAMLPAESNRVSIETALHADLALSLALDFLDITIMFNEALEKDTVLRTSSPASAERWICFSTLILSLTATLTLGFAFPTQQAEEASGQADIFLSAKFQFLVGLFLLDIPFLGLRIYWMSRSLEKILWFFLKNVFTIFMRPLKLNQCCLAERERAKGTQRSFYEEPTLAVSFQQKQQQAGAGGAAAGDEQGKQQQQQQHHSTAATAAAVGRGVLGNIQRLRRRGTLLRSKPQGDRGGDRGDRGGDRGDRGGDRGGDAVVSSVHGSKEFLGSYFQGSSIGSGFVPSSAVSESDEETDTLNHASPAAGASASRDTRLPMRQRHFVKDLKYSRRIPSRGVGSGRLIWRFFWLLLNCGRGGLKTTLDGASYLSYGQQLWLSLGSLLLDVLHVVLVFVGFCLFITDTQANATFTEFFPAVAWHAMSRRDQVIGILLAVSTGVCFFTSVFWAPFFDCLCCSFHFAVRQLSRCLLYRILGFTYLQTAAAATAGETGFQAHHAVGLMLTICFLAKPVSNLITLASSFPLSLCGKHYYTLRSDHYVRNTAVMPFHRVENLSPAPRFVSLSNVVMFSLCRKGAAPVAFHSLLIGPDTTKGFRVSDGLMEALWLDLVLGMFFRVWGYCLELSWYYFGVFCGYLLTGLLYALLSQTVRGMALRRFEMKLMLESLVRDRRDDFRIFGEADSSADELQRQRSKKERIYSYILVGDEPELYRTDGFVSSPGTVFPGVV